MPRPRNIQDQTLLQNAMRLFWRNGFAKTGIRELESALGLKAPSIYNRFGSKEALFQAALAHYLETVVGWRIQHYLQADDPLLGLREFFDTTYNYISDQKPPLACLLVNTSLEMNPDDALVAEQLRTGAEMIRQAFQHNLSRAQKMGLLATNANIERLAEFLHISLQGLLVTTKVENDQASLKHKVDILFSLLPITAASHLGVIQ